MNKYIRTKDGIYETWENGETYNGFGCKFNYGTIKIHKKDVIKQADTIEELCDEFVFEMGLEHTLVTIGYEQIRDNILTCELLDMSNLYGAIWVDGKGLIYVAKLNKDGELVLI